jgi:hypothetical protein
MPDIAAAFPRPVSRPRQRQLPEDVQYDDDADVLTVHYVTPSPSRASTVGMTVNQSPTPTAADVTATTTWTGHVF